jgi:predicted RecB family nuclease
VPKSVATDGRVIFGGPPPPPPPPSVRTPLEWLDIADETRKALVKGGIRDVDGILETDPDKLASILGSADMAKRLVEMARRLLGTQPAPAPTIRTDLGALGVDARVRRRLEEGGIRDVEGLLEAEPAKLAEIVGDRAAASKLIETARRVLAPTPTGEPTEPRKKSVRKKRK